MEQVEVSEDFKFESTLKEKIYDNIHGFIYLNGQEKNLLSNPYLQRLHFIKQNALANFIFPGATHTRFAHSIGVLHITEKIIQRFKKLNRIKIQPIDHQVMRLAALLHDVGHYPFSHTIEASYMEYARNFMSKESVAQLTKTSDISKLQAKIKDGTIEIYEFLKVLENDKSFFHHENIAQVIINETSLKNDVKTILVDTLAKQGINEINEALIDSYIKLIGNIITGKLDYTGNDILKQPENEEKYYILSQIINSSLDADQMDYMCRDTDNTGIKTTIRLDFIIDNIDICMKKFESGETKPALCFKIKALQSVEQFLLSKFYWYSEILYYDKIHILNLIACRLNIFMLLADQDKTYHNKYNTIDAYKQLISDPQKFFFFNDNYFWDKIEKIITSNDNLGIIKSFSNRLINKKIPKILGIKDFKEIFEDLKEKKYEDVISYSSKLLPIDFSGKPEVEEYFKSKVRNKSSNYFPVIITKDIFSPKNSEVTANVPKEYLNDKNINISYCIDDECSFKECTQQPTYAISIAQLKEHFLSQFYEEDYIHRIKPKALFKYLIYDFQD